MSTEIVERLPDDPPPPPIPSGRVTVVCNVYYQGRNEKEPAVLCHTAHGAWVYGGEQPYGPRRQHLKYTDWVPLDIGWYRGAGPDGHGASQLVIENVGQVPVVVGLCPGWPQMDKAYPLALLLPGTSMRIPPYDIEQYRIALQSADQQGEVMVTVFPN